MRGSRAVIVGAADYGAGSGLGSHSTIARSAEEWERFLKTDPLWESSGEDTGSDNQVRRLERRDLQSVDGVLTAVRHAAAEANDMLLVIYIGHGAPWLDAPGNKSDSVHLAVETSRRDDPWTWLPFWCLQRVMKESSALAKVLIADCCHSDKLHLGNGATEDDLVSEAFNAMSPEGTLVIRAVKDIPFAAAMGCPRLDNRGLRECTVLSGHLIDLLYRGVAGGGDTLKAFTVVNKLWQEMRDCRVPAPKKHPVPGRAMDGDLSELGLFTNKLADPVRRSPIVPSSVREWISVLRYDWRDLGPLLEDLEKLDAVVTGLGELPGSGEDQAREVHQQALSQLPSDRLADYLRIRASRAA